MKSLIENTRAVNLAEIARITNYSPSYVWRIANGQRTNPKAVKKVKDAINQISKAAA